MLNIFKKNPKKVYKVTGMHCASCAMVIESDLEDVGIKASCSYAKQTIEISESEIQKEAYIKEVVKKAGYTIVE
jgi:copper chaperone CopZ